MKVFVLQIHRVLAKHTNSWCAICHNYIMFIVKSYTNHSQLNPVQYHIESLGIHTNDFSVISKLQLQIRNTKMCAYKKAI